MCTQVSRACITGSWCRHALFAGTQLLQAADMQLQAACHWKASVASSTAHSRVAKIGRAVHAVGPAVAVNGALHMGAARCISRFLHRTLPKGT